MSAEKYSRPYYYKDLDRSLISRRPDNEFALRKKDGFAEVKIPSQIQIRGRGPNDEYWIKNHPKIGHNKIPCFSAESQAPRGLYFILIGAGNFWNWPALLQLVMMFEQYQIDSIEVEVLPSSPNQNGHIIFDYMASPQTPPPSPQALKGMNGAVLKEIYNPGGNTKKCYKPADYGTNTPHFTTGLASGSLGPDATVEYGYIVFYVEDAAGCVLPGAGGAGALQVDYEEPILLLNITLTVRLWGYQLCRICAPEWLSHHPEMNVYFKALTVLSSIPECPLAASFNPAYKDPNTGIYLQVNIPPENTPGVDWYTEYTKLLALWNNPAVPALNALNNIIKYIKDLKPSDFPDTLLPPNSNINSADDILGFIKDLLNNAKNLIDSGTSSDGKKNSFNSSQSPVPDAQDIHRRVLSVKGIHRKLLSHIRHDKKANLRSSLSKGWDFIIPSKIQLGFDDKYYDLLNTSSSYGPLVSVTTLSGDGSYLYNPKDMSYFDGGINAYYPLNDYTLRYAGDNTYVGVIHTLIRSGQYLDWKWSGDKFNGMNLSKPNLVIFLTQFFNQAATPQSSVNGFNIRIPNNTQLSQEVSIAYYCLLSPWPINNTQKYGRPTCLGFGTGDMIQGQYFLATDVQSDLRSSLFSDVRFSAQLITPTQTEEVRTPKGVLHDIVSFAVGAIKHAPEIISAVGTVVDVVTTVLADDHNMLSDETQGQFQYGEFYMSIPDDIDKYTLGEYQRWISPRPWFSKNTSDNINAYEFVGTGCIPNFSFKVSLSGSIKLNDVFYASSSANCLTLLDADKERKQPLRVNFNKLAHIRMEYVIRVAVVHAPFPILTQADMALALPFHSQVDYEFRDTYEIAWTFLGRGGGNEVDFLFPIKKPNGQFLSDRVNTSVNTIGQVQGLMNFNLDSAVFPFPMYGFNKDGSKHIYQPGDKIFIKIALTVEKHLQENNTFVSSNNSIMLDPLVGDQTNKMFTGAPGLNPNEDAIFNQVSDQWSSLNQEYIQNSGDPVMPSGINRRDYAAAQNCWVVWADPSNIGFEALSNDQSFIPVNGIPKINQWEFMNCIGESNNLGVQNAVVTGVSTRRLFNPPNVPTYFSAERIMEYFATSSENKEKEKSKKEKRYSSLQTGPPYAAPAYVDLGSTLIMPYSYPGQGVELVQIQQHTSVFNSLAGPEDPNDSLAE